MPLALEEALEEHWPTEPKVSFFTEAQILPHAQFLVEFWVTFPAYTPIFSFILSFLKRPLETMYGR